MEPFLYKEYKYVWNDFSSKQPGSIRDTNISNNITLLLNTINAIPGINILNWGHYSQNNLNNEKVVIFFHYETISDNDGLFFLLRSVDRRYFNFDVDIKMSVSDLKHKNGDLPIIYEIHIQNQKYATIEDIIIYMVNSMNSNINHDNFIKSYDIDLSKFSIRTLNDIRDEKIKYILNDR
jgi:hypothetical protein